MKKFKQAFTLAFVVFLAFYLFAIVKGAKNPYENLFSKDKSKGETNIVNENKGQDDDKKEVEEPEEEPQQMIDDEFMFVMFGTDSHDIDVSKGYRSDTIILTKVNFKTGEVRMVNIPRDTRVNIPGHGLTKINAAHSYGGPNLLMKTIQDNFGINVDYYVKVDYTLVENFVDAIGGVDYNVPYDLIYTDPADKPPLVINIKAGMQHINGKDAVKVLRYRGNTSDIDRINRQQEFLKVVMDQALSLKNIGRLPKIFTSIKSNLRTNFGEKQILEAIVSLPKVDMNNLEMSMIPGEGKYVAGESFWIYYEKNTKDLLKENFGDYMNAQ